MSETEFKREDRERDRQLDHREELEREDIMSLAIDPWIRSYARTTRAIEEGVA